MGFFDSFKNWFKSEAAEVKSSVSEVGDKLDRDLTRRERELEMTPSEKLESIQGEISDDPFAAARDKIDGAQSKALAKEELAAEANQAEEAAAEAAEIRDVAAASETIATANEASRAEEILRNLNEEVRGES